MAEFQQVSSLIRDLPTPGRMHHQFAFEFGEKFDFPGRSNDAPRTHRRIAMATVRVFIGTAGGQFLAGGQTLQFDFFQPLDDAYWELSVVPTGTNVNLEIIRKFIDADPGGVRRLHYVVRNNTNNGTFFTRGAIRAPE
jgi:hypothetical protein